MRGEDPFQIHRGIDPFRIVRGDVSFRIHHQRVIRIFQRRYSVLVRIGSRFRDAMGGEPECIRPLNPRAMTGGERFISWIFFPLDVRLIRFT